MVSDYSQKNVVEVIHESHSRTLQKLEMALFYSKTSFILLLITGWWASSWGNPYGRIALYPIRKQQKNQADSLPQDHCLLFY